MSDIRVEKLAELVVNYSVRVKKGDKVVIQGDGVAEPLLKAIYANVVKNGGYPYILASFPWAEELMYKYGTDEQLEFVNEPTKLIYNTYDCRIVVLSDQNTKTLSNVDSTKTVLRAKARTELMKVFMKRSAAGELRWVIVPFPTNAYAQDAEMSLTDYEDFVYGACLPDLNDPIGYWNKFTEWQERIVQWLKGKKKIHVVGKETDLHLSVAGRTFVNCNGTFNLPDGEVFTGPVEDSANGHVYYSYPAIYGGHEVEGVRLWFKNGEVVKATAEKNEEFLLKTIATDEGAKRLGEFAIGTNDSITKFTREILFDEKIGGSFHMALGSGYPETGSVNESAIHWDMVCDLRDGGEIWVDNELMYKNGKFVI